MGKTRKISTDDVLDAAERVVVRLGAVGLSIDEVAREAGISKSRVVYDFKTKSGLLNALVERRIRIDRERVAESVRQQRDSDNPPLFGRLTAAGALTSDSERAVALAICAASSHDEGVQAQFRQCTADDLTEVTREAKRPRASLVAYLAFYGLTIMEYFDLHQWSEVERAGLLQDIGTMYAAFPEI
ncbi:AcrR family transcriptional regulator [Rhizobium sp. SG_E_25_P2]|uniref:TetR/AcrR family transcriptional regulator n=1 Tax=Rhizobium sp. SG_E_25_P2 TaxID=2879942 RepID=UPI0024763033|nr:TetR/AcrR family transcriptional regulator [Rhizobium sp. SG_E_25_P2]MDH6269758.1 AcrR family transcriptional regulator [Rhizobium sp. SG_E_25_P2]